MCEARPVPTLDPDDLSKAADASCTFPFDHNGETRDRCVIDMDGECFNALTV